MYVKFKSLIKAKTFFQSCQPSFSINAKTNCKLEKQIIKFFSVNFSQTINFTINTLRNKIDFTCTDEYLLNFFWLKHTFNSRFCLRCGLNILPFIIASARVLVMNQ